MDTRAIDGQPRIGIGMPGYRDFWNVAPGINGVKAFAVGDTVPVGGTPAGPDRRPAGRGQDGVPAAWATGPS
ncbi:MAG: hypothetical protein JWQ45_2809 [Blastococcus sp.]|jgi:hypothetical protein|nr:hypothetical protein [Blastococcus sp.]